jgi:hypothetical protein
VRHFNNHLAHLNNAVTLPEIIHQPLSGSILDNLVLDCNWSGRRERSAGGKPPFPHAAIAA